MKEPVYREHKPTVPDVLPWVDEIYSMHRAGCCLHIVTDDDNIDDGSVEFCIQFATEQQHEYCAAVARALRSMSRTQRTVIARNHI